jgi:hypothetical protein
MHVRLCLIALAAVCGSLCPAGDFVAPPPPTSDNAVAPVVPVPDAPHGKRLVPQPSVPANTTQRMPLPSADVVKSPATDVASLTSEIWTSQVPEAYWSPYGPMHGFVAVPAGELHVRHPYYSYRRPWYTPGPASLNVTIVW